MQFVSDSELIFKVCVGGQYKLVSFGERSDAGSSVFITKDPILAQAIRNTRYFKTGRIVEDLSKAEDMYYDSVEEARAQQEQKSAETGELQGTASENPTGTEPAGEAAGTGAEPSGEAEGTGAEEQQGDASQNPTGAEVMKFDSITFAKNYLAKTFGIDKKSLKTPEQVIAAAEEKGVKIEF